jgi:hypothetical protein
VVEEEWEEERENSLLWRGEGQVGSEAAAVGRGDEAMEAVEEWRGEAIKWRAEAMGWRGNVEAVEGEFRSGGPLEAGPTLEAVISLLQDILSCSCSARRRVSAETVTWRRRLASQS